jgi:hypothetical protein
VENTSALHCGSSARVRNRSAMMRSSLSEVRRRVARLAAQLVGTPGCMACRDASPQRCVWDSVPMDEPTSVPCNACGRQVPIHFTILRWMDERTAGTSSMMPQGHRHCGQIRPVRFSDHRSCERRGLIPSAQNRRRPTRTWSVEDSTASMRPSTSTTPATATRTGSPICTDALLKRTSRN